MWSDDERWGVLLAPELDDSVFAHFTALDMAGFKKLAPGQRVEVEVEDLAPHFQDGYRYRALHVSVLD